MFVDRLDENAYAIADWGRANVDWFDASPPHTIWGRARRLIARTLFRRPVTAEKPDRTHRF